MPASSAVVNTAPRSKFSFYRQKQQPLNAGVSTRHTEVHRLVRSIIRIEAEAKPKFPR